MSLHGTMEANLTPGQFDHPGEKQRMNILSNGPLPSLPSTGHCTYALGADSYPVLQEHASHCASLHCPAAKDLQYSPEPPHWPAFGTTKAAIGPFASAAGATAGG